MRDHVRQHRHGFRWGSQGGFTIIELLLVMAVFAIAAATTLPFLGSFQEQETIDAVTANISRNLRTAQQMAMAGEHDSSWGVRFGHGTYTIYAGKSYDSRQPALDRRHAFPLAFTFSGPDEVNFAEGTGETTTGSGVLLIGTPGGLLSSISINMAGAVFFNGHP